MNKKFCKTCIFFKMQSDPQTKVISKVCYANPPTLTPVPTQQGLGFLTIRPQVADTDFCRLHIIELITH